MILFKANYQFSPFIAEMANSFSNVVTILIGLYGGYIALEQKLPTRYLIGFLVCPTLASFVPGSSLTHPFDLELIRRVSLSSE